MDAKLLVRESREAMTSSDLPTQILLGIARLNTESAVRETNISRLYTAIAAVLSEGASFDERDSMLQLVIIADAAERLGLSADSVLAFANSTAELADSRILLDLVSMALRDHDLAKFGWLPRGEGATFTYGPVR